MALQILSVSIDFYVRVFVRVYTSPKEVKNAAANLMYIYQSSACDSFFSQPVGLKVYSTKRVIPSHSLPPLLGPVRPCSRT